MENSLEYKMQSLMINKKPKALEVRQFFYERAMQVYPMHPYTLRKIIKKTPLTFEDLDDIKNTMIIGENNQKNANFNKYRLEYKNSIKYINNLMADKDKEIINIEQIMKKFSKPSYSLDYSLNLKLKAS